MRTSSKIDILTAAIRLVEAGGITRVTLDATAKEAGLSKGGLIYHYPTKELLRQDVVRHIAQRGHDALVETLGMPVEAATLEDRVRAYIAISGTRFFSRAELNVFADAIYDPTLIALWNEQIEGWFQGLTDLPAAERARLDAARFAADGLWIALATGIYAPSPADLTAVIDQITTLTYPEGTA